MTEYIKDFFKDIETPEKSRYFRDVIELIIVAGFFIGILNVTHMLWSLFLRNIFILIGY